MKILHVISDRNIGGAGVLLCNLLRHMDRSRIESVVAIPRGSALGERISALQIPVRELKYPCDRLSPFSVREIEGLLRREGFGGVHAVGHVGHVAILQLLALVECIDDVLNQSVAYDVAFVKLHDAYALDVLQCLHSSRKTAIRAAG